MKIFIPTLHRTDKQTTWDNLPDFIKPYTTLVICKEEEKFHNSRDRNTLVSEVQGTGMAATRTWIMEYCFVKGIDKMLFMDDDLRLQMRDEETLRVTGYASKNTYKKIFMWISKSLDKYVHCALTERNAAWADSSKEVEVSKGIQVVGYNSKLLKTIPEEPMFNKGVPNWFFIEDYHMTLQLFELGIPNLVSRRYRHNPAPSNNPGGCSKFRSTVAQREAAHLLQELHPNYVKAVQKKTKSAWGGGTRWDVNVQWKKAYKDSKNQKLLLTYK